MSGRGTGRRTMLRKVKVYVGSRALKPVEKEAEVCLEHPTVTGKISGLLPEMVAGLRPCNEPWVCFTDPGTSQYSHQLELLDAQGNFVATPCGTWSITDPLSPPSVVNDRG